VAEVAADAAEPVFDATEEPAELTATDADEVIEVAAVCRLDNFDWRED